MWANLAHPWQACAEMAWEAFGAGCVPIGAAITGPDGQVIAVGRNRLYEPRAIGPDRLAGISLAHAEINALLALEGQPVNPRECTLYTTTEPCPQCAGALVMCNLRHVCYASRDPWAGSADLLSANPYVRKKHIRVEGPPDPLFEILLIAIQAEFMLREAARRSDPGRINRLLEALRGIVPAGAVLGERLYRDRTLFHLYARRLPTGEVFDLLEAMLTGERV